MNAIFNGALFRRLWTILVHHNWCRSKLFSSPLCATINISHHSKKLLDQTHIRSCGKWEVMVRDLNYPHIFLTFTAVDMQWHNHYRYMAQKLKPFKCSTGTERGRLAHRLLQENLHILVKVLDGRFHIFLQHVLKTQYVQKRGRYIRCTPLDSSSVRNSKSNEIPVVIPNNHSAW